MAPNSVGFSARAHDLLSRLHPVAIALSRPPETPLRASASRSQACSRYRRIAVRAAWSTSRARSSLSRRQSQRARVGDCTRCTDSCQYPWTPGTDRSPISVGDSEYPPDPIREDTRNPDWGPPRRRGVIMR